MDILLSTKDIDKKSTGLKGVAIKTFCTKGAITLQIY